MDSQVQGRLDRLFQDRPEEHRMVLEMAAKWAVDSQQEQLRASGEPYHHQVLAVADTDPSGEHTSKTKPAPPLAMVEPISRDEKPDPADSPDEAKQQPGQQPVVAQHPPVAAPRRDSRRGGAPAIQRVNHTIGEFRNQYTMRHFIL